jgi:hypothetical protein
VIKNQTQNWASLVLAIFWTCDRGTWNRAWYLETRPKNYTWNRSGLDQVLHLAMAVFLDLR